MNGCGGADVQPPTVRPSRLVLLGDPVAHSLSPVFQNAALRAAGLHARYEVLQTPAMSLAPTIDMLRRDHAAGNVTVPHKEQFAAHCNLLTDVAARSGAVNTYWFADDMLVGDNTDVAGAERALQWVCSERGASHCLLIGAGGSAAALLFALQSLGVSSVTILARNIKRAEALLQRTGSNARIVADEPAQLDAFDLVVNATPLGMLDDAMPVDVDLLHRKARVLDVVYRSGGTKFVRRARELGMHADDGLRMLVEQGACAFERWFGFEPDRSVMWQSLGGYR